MEVLEKTGKVDHNLVHEHHGMAWVDGVMVEPHYKVHNYQCPSTDHAMQEMFASVFPSELSSADMGGYAVPVYHPEADGGISILDESLGIDWRIPTEHANLSEKDTKHEVLKDFESPFEY